MNKDRSFEEEIEKLFENWIKPKKKSTKNHNKPHDRKKAKIAKASRKINRQRNKK